MAEPNDTDGRSRRDFLAGVGAAGVAAFAGCTSAEEESETNVIDIAGSSTVFPLAATMSERFEEENDNVTTNLNSTGSGGGFADYFCPGQTDFNNASRPIREEEEAQCAENDVEPVELTVATDALTVVVNNDSPVDNMTVEELAQIWDDDGTEMWSDVNSEWPDQEIELYGPTDASGTYDYFIESVLHAGDEERDHRQDYSATEQDRNIIQGVEGSENAIGYLGFAYYSQSKDRVKALGIDDGDGPVKPSLDTARTGEYTPLSRPLFTYPAKSALAEDHIADFARFWVERANNQEIVADEVGYVPLSDEQQSKVSERLETAIEEAGN